MQIKKQLFFLVVFVYPFIGFSQKNIDLLILNKKYDQALTEIEKQIETHPKAGLYLKQGMIYQNLQDYQQALQAFTTGLQFAPDNIELLSQAAESFSILGNNIDAINFYTRASDLAPENLSMAAKLGRVYINLKNYKAAYEVFSSIYELDSTNVYWNKQLAYAAFRTFKREQASYLYEKVLEANPRDHSSYSNLIHTYNWKKEGGKILETVDKGLAQFPNDPELLYERAMYMYKTKQYGLAMENFDNFLKFEKDPAYETMMNIAISTYFADYVEKALERFNKLMQLNPNDPLVMYYQSLCYKKMNDFEKSEELMQWAIDASTPNYVAEMYHHLGQIYGQQRKFSESVIALEKAHELNPKKKEVLFEIATTYEEFNSNKTLALNYYRVYLEEVGDGGKNRIYALDRIEKLKEDLFFEE
ncbi:tetratricopeptide repeat protein [uncultured Draconibacterium sp.]|uniref:tetratricopeptide repeat protein n=1 Tax=uncultured Draconibacterium sp. TaxID=1573823 RepID=UPI003216B49F